MQGYSLLMVHIIAQAFHWQFAGAPQSVGWLKSTQELQRSASARAKLARKNSSLALRQALANADGPFAGVQALLAMKSSVRVCFQPI